MRLESRLKTLKRKSLEEQLEIFKRECEGRCCEDLGFFADHGYWPELESVKEGSGDHTES